ncbi:xanthine dehydrogenase family protein molybdopterin-binding subunit [Olivibacter domesticus]|uniref:CO or xanthine dehydrogenase, Mo-binding subunit n=1 Tax=Olivibacter domesticus TaxID=407022 RepID=A0A1H7SKD1_OLID1|nr:molybdopterin cofactor-binding domain-containing protein [Olivibacter domesticus]SEL72164.1 CO or xanthine dehydrogenase, Mo-binding subunit [Olivibacter domesticus]
MKRKTFLKQTSSLLISFNLFPLGSCFDTGNNNGLNLHGDPNTINAWLQLNRQGKITLFTGKMELGQGIRIALKQIAAEELDVDIKRINIIIADTGQTPDEGYTVGSGSIEGSGMAIRQAAAEARLLLLEQASQKLQRSIRELQVKDGVVQFINDPTISVSYWELLKGRALNGKITGNAPPKDAREYQLIGTSIPRDDIVNMVTGQSAYVHDIRLPGMIHARVVRPPSYGAELRSFPKSKIMAMDGVIDIIKNGSFLAVVAQEEYTAIKAWNILRKESTWNTKRLLPLQANLFDDMLHYKGKQQIVEEISGNQQNMMHQHEALYKSPYHMHASIGPSCALAKWESDQLTVWTHSQGVYPLRKSLAGLLNIPEQKIRVIGVPGAGCYGHNGADDVAADATLIAYHLPGKAVRVQWMREDEHMWEPYGSAMAIKIKGSINNNGKMSAWHTDLWSDTHSTRPGGKASHLLAAQYVEPKLTMEQGDISGGASRNALPLYNIPTMKVVAHAYQGPLRTSALRSLGAYANIFALESFIDELAFLAQRDPLHFRIDHINDPRALEVLRIVTEKTAWSTRTKKQDTGLGLAFAQYKNRAAYFAVVAEITIDKAKKEFKVKKLTGAIDAGQAINIDGLKNQTEGGMIQSASWSLFEQVDYSDEGVSSNTWDSYPIMRFTAIPDIEVVVINRPTEKPLGAGEAAQGPTVAAIANAIFAATGTRIRDLPLSSKKVNW